MPKSIWDISTIIKHLSAVGIRGTQIPYLPDLRNVSYLVRPEILIKHFLTLLVLLWGSLVLLLGSLVLLVCLLPFTFSVVGVFAVERSVGIKEAASTAATFLCSSLFFWIFSLAAAAFNSMLRRRLTCENLP